VTGPAGPRRLEAVVRGRVQGVGYRVFVARRASALGLAGWVANAPDGSVVCVAEGEDATLRSLLEDLRAGPPAAWVRDVAERWTPPVGLRPPFAVRSGAHTGD
jgi:acylphosphatase